VELSDELWNEVEALNFSTKDPEASREYKPG
jgi:hypothetical protein